MEKRRGGGFEGGLIPKCTLWVNNILATCVLKKANALSLGTNSFSKKERDHFEQRTSRKKQYNFDSG